MKSLARVRKRHGRCYELTARAMISEPESDSWMLVHGGLGGGWFHHAWIELDDGRIYDPSFNDYTPADQYATKRRAVADHRYSRTEVCALLGTTPNYYGPWTDGE